MEVNEHTEVLIKAIVRGDKKAFGQLFRMWYVRLCLYAESIVRDRDMAEDLVQNLFCMLGKKGRDRYPGIDEGLFVSLCLSRCSQFVKT